MPRIIEVKQPEVHLIESCNQPPINVQCPQVNCSSFKENLLQWVKFAKDVTEKLSTCYEAREELDNLLKNEKDETEYYRKKYVDFSCKE